MRKTLKVTSVTNGAAGSGSGIFSANIPHGHDVSGFFLSLTNGGSGGAAAIGTIANIKLIGDGDILWDVSGVQFDEVNKARGLAAYDGTTLYLPCGYDKQRDMVPAIGTAIKTGPGGFTDLRLEVTLSGASTPEFDLRIECVEEAGIVPGPEGRMVRRLRQYQDSVTANAESSTTKLMYGKGGHKYWAGAFLYPASGNITKVRMKRGDTEVLDLVKAVNDYQLVRGGSVVGSYFGFSLDFLASGFPEPMNTGDLSQGDKNLDLLVTCDSSVVLTYVMDTYGPK